MNKIILAISVFRSDEKVINLLTSVFIGNESPYLDVIIVDSQPTGLLEQYIADKKLKLKYITSDNNLGSAGNLQSRLEEASKNSDADWCFCLNHDAYYTKEFAKSFLEEANKLTGKIGAVFPTRSYDNGRIIDSKQSNRELTWSSSNGCLYSLKPIRDGLRPAAELWMGWEDYFYCITLCDNGYRNFLVNSLPFIDSYEYQQKNILGLQFKLNNKPPWYDYYSIRNLIYIYKVRTVDKLFLSLFFKVVVNSLILSLLKSNKFKRISLFYKGIVDGINDRMGFRGFFK